MDMTLIYRLSDSGYTIYHRAALGGLAATIRSWGNNQPPGIRAESSADAITIGWANDLPGHEALRRILAASFKLTDDNLIDLPGQAVALGAEDLRLAIHNALTSTFLQHNKMRPAPPGEKGVRAFMLKTADEEMGVIVTYKAVGQYAHQIAQNTGLLDHVTHRDASVSDLPDVGKISQWCVPGATGQRAGCACKGCLLVNVPARIDAIDRPPPSMPKGVEHRTSGSTVGLACWWFDQSPE
jgi:hypothetical protein